MVDCFDMQKIVCYQTQTSLFMLCNEISDNAANVYFAALSVIQELNNTLHWREVDCTQEREFNLLYACNDLQQHGTSPDSPVQIAAGAFSIATLNYTNETDFASQQCSEALESFCYDSALGKILAFILLGTIAIVGLICIVYACKRPVPHTPDHFGEAGHPFFMLPDQAGAVAVRHAIRATVADDIRLEAVRPLPLGLACAAA